MKFSDFPLDPDVLYALEKMGYETPTPIQEASIPLVIAKRDVIALAETGSGKTAACAIPLIHLINEEERVIQALIVVPTRELALQYATELQKIGLKKKIKAFALFGGEDYEIQRAKLKNGVHVLIATPGRLIDFIYGREIDLTHVGIFVLDEADRILGLGFLEDLEFIFNCLIHKHQTLLFSATMPEEIHKIASKHLHHPEKINLIAKQASPDKITHLFTFVKNASLRERVLAQLLKDFNPRQSIVFCNSRHEVENVAHSLKAHISHVDFLHGGLSQNIRNSITGKFRKERIHCLVATDVAARGLDFSVTHVINFHLPRDIETYLHRSGRTGRGGREGICISFCTTRDLPFARLIQDKLEKEIEWLIPPPSLSSPKRER